MSPLVEPEGTDFGGIRSAPGSGFFSFLWFCFHHEQEHWCLLGALCEFGHQRRKP